MKKIFIVSILAIAMLVACVGCSFGVAPEDYTLPSRPSSHGDGSTTKPTGNPSNPSDNPSPPTTNPTPEWHELDQTVYTPALVVFDKSNPKDIQINLGSGVASVKSIGYIGQTPNTWNFKFENENGRLYIPKTFFETKNAGKSSLKVYTNDGNDSITCQLYCATKVITTCADFQNISNDLNGTYVLGADLDFEDFGNFNPIGNDAQKHGDKTGLAFTGTLIGAGHTISNLTADADDMGDDEVYTEHDVYVDATNKYSKVRSCFGIFMRNEGTIEDICFKDCTVKNSYGTVMGLVVVLNEGLIKNVFVDGGKVDGGSIWLDYNCFNAGFVGMNGGSGKIENCVSTVTQIKADTKGTLARAFCGKTWGEIKNCYACTDGIALEDLATGSINNQGIIGSDIEHELSDATGYGFTYQATESGIPMGSFDECSAMDGESLKQASLYTKYDNNIWEISEGTLPALKVLFNKG